MRAADFADRPTHELALRPIRRRKVSDEAALRLESMIRDGAFPEGALLPPERELMKMFGVGRASIREALSCTCATANGRWSRGRLRKI
jgi:DNA-binding GntR family transcriptional regulator